MPQSAKERNVEAMPVAVFNDFSGGLDSFNKRDAMPKNSAWLCENVMPRRRIQEPNKVRGLCTMPGLYRILENPTGVGPGDLSFVTEVVTTGAASGRWLFALDRVNGRVYVSPWPIGPAWTLVTTIAGLTELRAASLAGVGIICLYGSGVGGMFTWNGAALAAIPGAPVARFIAVHGNRAFVAGAAATPWRIQYCNYRSPAAGYDLNLIDDVDNDSGWQITGLIEFQGMIFIATGLGFWALRGETPSDYSLLKLSNSVGCSSPDTLKTDGSSIFFLSNRGFYQWDGGSEPTNISLSIWNFYRADFDPALANTAISAYHDFAYYVTYRTIGGTTKYRTFVYDLYGKGWYPTSQDRWPFGGMCGLENGLYILATSATTGRLYQMDAQPDDDGVGVSLLWANADWTGDATTVTKRLSHVEILAEIEPRQDLVKLDLLVHPDLNPTGRSLVTDANTDIEMRGEMANPGSHVGFEMEPYDRTVLLFRMGETAGAARWNTLSWAISRAASKGPICILEVRLYAFTDAKVN